MYQNVRPNISGESALMFLMNCASLLSLWLTTMDSLVIVFIGEAVPILALQVDGRVSQRLQRECRFKYTKRTGKFVAANELGPGQEQKNRFTEAGDF